MRINRRLTSLPALPVLFGLVAALAHCSGDDNGSTLPADGGAADGSTVDASKASDASTQTDATGADAGGDATTTADGGADGATDGGAASSDAGDGGITVSGVVASSILTPGSATDPTIAAGHFSGAKVCVDANDNGKCDTGETSAPTDANGVFKIALSSASDLIADIGTTATNNPASGDGGTGAANASRNVFRISADQVTEQGTQVVISPLSTEIVRLMEANSTTYAVEKQNVATRLTVGTTTVTADQVVADASTLTGAVQKGVLYEENILTNRFQYAITKLDRGDLYPDALAVPGGDPELTPLVGDGGVTAATATTTTARSAITFKQAEQAAFNVEAIPRYDAIFIVMLENKSTQAILNSPFAPHINGYLTAGNQAASYYATGNPSEPNYTALGGADDFGITDDNQWNTNSYGANAPTDSFLPTAAHAGLASSPFLVPSASDVDGGVAHNIVGRANIFNALTSAGMTWRTYSESMNPGQDFRTDSVADPAVTAPDHVYAAGTVGAADAGAVGNPDLVLPLPSNLYRTKHHPGMAYQNVRTSPEFNYSNRTLGGGQWDSALSKSTAYTIPSGYDYDQFGTDLASGNVGNVNFVIPDQCDDMHGIGVTGTITTDAGTSAGTASDCSSVNNNVAVDTGGAIITRGDNYVDYVVKKIQASNLWKNPQRHVAIVLMFDEGSATTGLNSCCGWKASQTVTNAPLNETDAGAFVPDTTVVGYTAGNKGHGMSIFGVLTNGSGPKGIVDTDAYSHFSFVRTLQDMFGVADPANDGSYMNRSKYTEKFIDQNIMNLPEFWASSDTHYDSVRPMNHAFVIPDSYTAKTSIDSSPSRPAQTGHDATQTNIWATK